MKIFFIGIFIILLAIGTTVVSRKAAPNSSINQPSTSITSPQTPSISNVPYTIETVVENVFVPWAIAFTSPTRMLFTERNGQIRIVENGTLVEESLISFFEVSSSGEEGLMGLAVDPEYAVNSYLYTALAYPKNNGLVVKIVRLIDKGQTATVEQILLDNIPAARNHAGTRLGFGPDRKLYITTGDASNRKIAQDKNSLGGKILRINTDGTIPTDNPFSNSPVYSLGHRNPQGISWHPATQDLYETEHGPSTFDGPPGGDEVNRIIAGENYGWPLVSHDKKQSGLVDPLVVYTPAVAPASLLVYSGSVFPQFKHNLFFGGLVGTGIYRVVLDENNPDQIVSKEKLSDISVGRIREVVEGPDGYIYFSTSNRDGRGKPANNDDRIMRLVPSK